LTFNLKTLAARYSAAIKASDEMLSLIGDGGDDVVYAKLEECIRAPQSILPAELDKLRELADSATNEIQRGAFEWKIASTTFQITQAARVAEDRLRLFDSLKTDADREAEKARYVDTLYWFRNYAWGYDPRAALKVVPFYPYPQQERYLLWLDDTVIRRQTSGVVEKSRDEGATVGALDWMVHKWLMVSGFSAFLVSANEDLVDTNKNPNTLFEKIRFQLRLTPSWQLPKGFSTLRDMPYMNISNPENGANIGGGAPTINVGRQRRATVVLADEFQSWPNGGFVQNTALSQTAFSVVKLGTPYGKQNQYYVDTHTEGANKFVLHWHDNPVKDERWYKALPFSYVGQPMSAAAIAQEVDRNYDASQPGRVFSNWQDREPYVLITWAELVAYYDQFQLGKLFINEVGEYCVPSDWNWGRMQDYGQTDAHKWIITHGARPRENYPLSDSMFIFGYIITPTGAAVGEVQPLIEAQQSRLGLIGTPELSQMSHEQCGEGGVADTFMQEHGEYWEAWNTDYDLGLPQIKEWLMLVDQTSPNPIRPQLMGRTRIYFVCANEIKVAHNPRTKEYFVTPSPSELSFKLARAEMGSYHYPVEEMGKPVQAMRPEKKKGMDNFIDTFRGFATVWGPSVAPMGKEERRVHSLPEYLQPSVVMAQLGQPQFTELKMEQEHTLRRMKIEEEQKAQEAARAWKKVLGGPVRRRRYHG
jgi:hypothetical protein